MEGATVDVVVVCSIDSVLVGSLVGRLVLGRLVGLLDGGVV